MVATLPINRIGFDSPRAVLPELPKSSRERGELWSDAVLHAVLTLKKQLTHHDTGIAAAAANSILELERTRIRHGRNVAGSSIVSEAQRQFEEEESRKHDRVHEKPKSKEEPGARTAEQAFAEHVEEVTEYSDGSDDPLGAPPSQFVTWLLTQWTLPANAVPKGGFMDRLREHGTGDKSPTAKAVR